jgi:hypothetical protein
MHMTRDCSVHMHSVCHKCGCSWRVTLACLPPAGGRGAGPDREPPCHPQPHDHRSLGGGSDEQGGGLHGPRRWVAVTDLSPEVHMPPPLPTSSSLSYLRFCCPHHWSVCHALHSRLCLLLAAPAHLCCATSAPQVMLPPSRRSTWRTSPRRCTGAATRAAAGRSCTAGTRGGSCRRTCSSTPHTTSA